MKYNFFLLSAVLFFFSNAHQVPHTDLNTKELEAFSEFMQNVMINPERVNNIQSKKRVVMGAAVTGIAAGVGLYFTDPMARSSVGLLGILVPDYIKRSLKGIDEEHTYLVTLYNQLLRKQAQWQRFYVHDFSREHWNILVHDDLEWIAKHKKSLKVLPVESMYANPHLFSVLQNLK